jgi:hypothetical protein
LSFVCPTILSVVCDIFLMYLCIGKEGNYKKLKLKPKTIIEIEIPN